MKKYTEAEVRRLRDAVYNHPKKQSDEGWEQCRHNWMKPENIRWLLEQPQNKTLIPSNS